MPCLYVLIATSGIDDIMVWQGTAALSLPVAEVEANPGVRALHVPSTRTGRMDVQPCDYPCVVGAKVVGYSDWRRWGVTRYQS